MAATPPRARPRPLSPHLQVYRKQVQMMSSITHRATGIALSAGALGLVWGLLALAGGPEQWERFRACAGSLPGLAVMIGFTWALAFHLINGIRHLLQDGGMGFSIADLVRNSWISYFGSVVLTVLAWTVLLLRWGQA